MKSSVKGYLYALIALFSWGVHGPAGRYLALQNVDMNFVTVSRFWIGALTFFVFLLIKKKIKFSFKENIKLVLATSLIGVTLNSILYHVTLIYLSATLVMILENLAPIFVFGMTYLVYREKPKFVEVLALILSQIWLVTIVLGKSQFTEIQDGFLTGVGLGILTGITFGAYTYFSGELMKKVGKNPIQIIQYLFLVFFISAIVGLPLFIGTKQLPQNFSSWFWLVEMGVFQSGISYLFWNYALVHLPANRVSILFLLTIVFTTINEILFLGLKLNLPLIIGGVFIILSGFILQRSDK